MQLTQSSSHLISAYSAWTLACCGYVSFPGQLVRVSALSQDHLQDHARLECVDVDEVSTKLTFPRHRDILLPTMTDVPKAHRLDHRSAALVSSR